MTLVFFQRTRRGAKERNRKLLDFFALTSVMSKWYGACIILRLEKDEEPDGGKQVHVGGIDGISCQHFQMMTQPLRKNTGSGMRTEDQ